MKSEYRGYVSLTVTGESHSPEMSCTLSGIPAGIPIDNDVIASLIKRRSAVNSAFSTARLEDDMPVCITGICDGVTSGGDITAVFKNRNVNSSAYESNSYVPRPSHADYPVFVKTGTIPPGGGHYSGRLTLPLTFAGAICKCVLSRYGIEIGAHIASIGNVYDDAFDKVKVNSEELKALSKKAFPVLSDSKGEEMLAAAESARDDGDSLGGTVECALTGVPAGLGAHMFRGLENVFSSLLFSVPGLKGVEFGSGFSGSELPGSVNNDSFSFEDGIVRTVTNNHGGVLGGLTSGMPVVFRCAFKPVPSIAKAQKSVNLLTGKEAELKLNGRFDACFVPRAVPVTEAIASIAMLDVLLESNAPETLTEARARIDACDSAIVSLLSERARLSLSVAEIKERENINTFDKSREGDIIARIKAAADAEIADSVINVYREILTQSKLLQQEKRKN